MLTKTFEKLLKTNRKCSKFVVLSYLFIDAASIIFRRGDDDTVRIFVMEIEGRIEDHETEAARC